MDPVTIVLKEPITAHGETVTQLVLKPPTLKNWRVRDGAKGEVDSIIRMISDLAGIPISSVEMLGTEDSAAAMEAVAELTRPFWQGKDLSP